MVRVDLKEAAKSSFRLSEYPLHLAENFTLLLLPSRTTTAILTAETNTLESLPSEIFIKLWQSEKVTPCHQLGVTTTQTMTARS